MFIAGDSTSLVAFQPIIWSTLNSPTYWVKAFLALSSALGAL